MSEHASTETERSLRSEQRGSKPKKTASTETANVRAISWLQVLCKNLYRAAR